MALCAADVVYEDVAFGVVNHGREETRRHFQEAFAAFPDLQFELTSLVVAGSRGAAEWTMPGTHTGDYPGLPATHQRLSVRGTSVFELAGDTIQRNRDYWDFATVLRQLGLLPEPASS